MTENQALDLLKFKSLEKERIDLLITFVNTKMNVEEFLDNDSSLQRELLKFTEIVSEDDLGESRNHELEHKKIWDKYKIRTEFRRELIGSRRCFVVDIDFDKRAREMDKSDVIEILKETCFAPYAAGHAYRSCESDLILYEILCKRQVNYPPDQHDRARMKKSYLKGTL